MIPNPLPSHEPIAAAPVDASDSPLAAIGSRAGRLDQWGP